MMLTEQPRQVFLQYNDHTAMVRAFEQNRIERNICIYLAIYVSRNTGMIDIMLHASVNVFFGVAIGVVKPLPQSSSNLFVLISKARIIR
jgi:hypothetical protein